MKLRESVAQEALKGAPAVAGSVTAAMTLSEWVAVCTMAYVIVQLLYLLRKWWREERGDFDPRGRS